MTSSLILAFAIGVALAIGHHLFLRWRHQRAGGQPRSRNHEPEGRRIGDGALQEGVGKSQLESGGDDSKQGRGR